MSIIADIYNFAQSNNRETLFVLLLFLIIIMSSVLGFLLHCVVKKDIF